MSEEWNNAVPAAQPRPPNGAPPPGEALRRRRAELGPGVEPPDRLPPHSAEGEAGVLGCLLLAPMEGIPQARRRLRDPDGGEFYDLRHREIWLTLGRMYDDRLAGKPLCSEPKFDGGIDVITIQQRLRDYQKLDAVGGVAYLAELPNRVPSAHNLEYYLDIVAEKFVVRETIRFLTAGLGTLQNFEGQIDAALARLQREFDGLAKLRLGEGEWLERLRPAGHWAEEVWNEFMGIHCHEERGWPLPIEFKFRVRLQECTLVTGDDGSGKSTFLNYTALHLAQAGARVCVASFEMPPKKTLRMLVTQAAGTHVFPESSAGQALFARAFSWVHKRFFIYDFLGIADWRDVLAVFQRAAEQLGVNVFILDSVMRIGIADDDYGTQGLAAARFAQFAQSAGVHLFLVIHENKGGEGGKGRVRGSKLWTANADNIVRIERNMKKGEKLSELWAERLVAEGRRDAEVLREIQKDYEEVKRGWDARAVLLKQREMGSQQNAAKRFYYDSDCFQYRDHFDDPPVNWLERWAPARPKSSEREEKT